MSEFKPVDASQTVINYEEEPAKPPPTLEVGAPAWLRQNLFGSPADIVVTIVATLLVLVLVVGFFDWAIRSANWFTIINNQRLFMMDRFERAFEWRLAIAVLIAAVLTGVSFSAWARGVLRGLTVIALAALIVVTALPPLINASVAQPKSYLTAGNVDIIDRASSLTPQQDLAFIAQAGDVVTLEMATDEVADIDTLRNLAGFSDRAANALANAAQNRLDRQAEAGEAFDRMISRELTEASEERMREAIRTFTRTSDIESSTTKLLEYVGDRLGASGASIGELKVWLSRLRDATRALDERDQAILEAIRAVQDAAANLTSEDAMTDDLRAAVAALMDTTLASAYIEDLGELLILHLTEDLIGERDQRDDDEELIEPTAWEAEFLRELFVRLLTPQSVVEVYELGQTPLQVAIRDAATLDVLAEGILTAAGEQVSYEIPSDGWYILSKTAAEGEEGSTLLRVGGLYPIVERTLSASESQFARITDNELEIFGLRPKIDGKPAPMLALIDNQFRGLRDLQVYLAHFVPLFFEQVERLLLPCFIAVVWGFALGRALAHLRGENTNFTSSESRVVVLAWSAAPLLILLLYFALLDGPNAAVTGLLASALRLAAAFGVVAVARRMEDWLTQTNHGEDAEAPISRLLIYGWGAYPFVMFVFASGVGGLSGAALGSIVGGLIWLLLMYLIGVNYRGAIGYGLLIGGFFLQLAQGPIINVVWESWNQAPLDSLMIWLALAVVGVGLGTFGSSRRESLPPNIVRVGYLVSCLSVLFILLDTNLVADAADPAVALLVAIALILWLGWVFFSGMLRWTSNRIIIGLIVLTLLWMQTWTLVDHWSAIYFSIWLVAGALAFKRGESAQGNLRKTLDQSGASLLQRFPLHSLGVAAAVWLAALLIVPSVVLGLEAQGLLQTPAADLFPLSDKRLWGGLMLTMQLTILGIGASFPIGLALALGRRSNLSVVKYACVLYIETVRGVPLITILFMAVLLVPLIDPSLATIENAVRAWVGITMFSAAYLAENVRGGLQSLDHGQTEAAQAIGLSGWQTTLYILLPQALRAVIPALVGQFISLFKDTSLVFIVGLAEIVGIAVRVVAQPEFVQRRQETFLYVAIIFFVFSYIMSYISRRVEATGSGAARAQRL